MVGSELLTILFTQILSLMTGIILNVLGAVVSEFISTSFGGIFGVQ